jgi:hypothetical protein
MEKGVVIVYEYNANAASGSQWQQLGDLIETEAAGDGKYASISLSGNGTTLAIGSPSHLSSGHEDSGLVRVYSWSPASDIWVRPGTDIEGTGSGEGRLFGASVSLSHDGSRLAIGCPGRSLVQVFEYTSYPVFWSQIGGDIESGSGSGFGNSVSLSGDGTRLAVGQPYQSDLTLQSTGNVKVYLYGPADLWVVKTRIDGPSTDSLTIVPDQTSDRFGQSVAMSSDGKSFAVGAPYYLAEGKVGLVRVYKDDSGTGDMWVQVHVDIRGTAWAFGISVALSSDGSKVAIGARVKTGILTRKKNDGSTKHS